MAIRHAETVFTEIWGVNQGFDAQPAKPIGHLRLGLGLGPQFAQPVLAHENQLPRTAHIQRPGPVPCGPKSQ